MYIIPSILIYGLLIIYTFWKNNKNKTELDKQIQELTFNMDTIAKNTLVNSPFPIVIVENTGNINWKNASFINEFGNTDVKGILGEVAKNIKGEISKNKKGIFTYEQIKIGKKDYKIIAQKLKDMNKRKKNNDIYALYIIDNTDLIEITKK